MSSQESLGRREGGRTWEKARPSSQEGDIRWPQPLVTSSSTMSLEAGILKGPESPWGSEKGGSSQAERGG